VADIVVDNAVIATTAGAQAAVFDGSWDTFGEGYCSRCLNRPIRGTTYYEAMVTGASGASAEYFPSISLKGKYDLYEWHPRFSGAGSARVEINYHGGRETVQIDQSVNSDQWNKIGTFEFGADERESVTIFSDGQKVLADAFMFVYRKKDSNRDITPPKRPENLNVKANDEQK
jgi:hypothetical protein